MVAFRQGEKLHFLNAKHKQPRKQELICDIEVKGLSNYDRVNERRERKKHTDPSERVASRGLYAEKSADSRDEYQHAERRSENSYEIESQERVERLNDG